MKKFIKRGTVLIVAAFLLAGCGDEMVVLTESEEEVVVNYSAGTLAKHNIHQQEGMSGVYPKEEEEELPVEEEEKKGQETEGQEQETEEQEQETEGQENGGQTEAGSEDSGAATLTEALAVPGLEFSYKDYSVSNNYKQGEYFSLDAAEGNMFVILNVNMTNTGAEAVSCDLLSKQPIFTLKINEEAGVKNEVTMLENDLSTFIGTLEPGQTTAGILVFEVSAEAAENVSAVQLSIQMGETITNIKM